MDLQELATNARLNHWPPHLGVKTDAEKIEYLATRLEEAGDAETRAEDLANQLTTAQEEVALLEGEVGELKFTLLEIRKLTNKCSESTENT